MTSKYFLLFFLLAIGACQEPSNTILITNVLIADGTGSEPYRGAVRLAGERILAMGDLKARSQEAVVDGQGKVLAPGFIDTHSHHDWGMFEKRAMPEVVSQGVTTIEEPGALSEGILKVWVNGALVWEGETTGQLPGKGIKAK